jgi:hypothetical protein
VSRYALGTILIAFGLLALVWGGFSFTTSQKLIDVGPIHATREKTHNFPLAPVGGALALAGGIAIVLSGRKRMA